MSEVVTSLPWHKFRRAVAVARVKVSDTGVVVLIGRRSVNPSVERCILITQGKVHRMIRDKIHKECAVKNVLFVLPCLQARTRCEYGWKHYRTSTFTMKYRPAIDSLIF